MISRRTFLAGTSAVAVAPLLPAHPVAEAAPVVVKLPRTTIWVGGHLGEFDWQPFHAATKKDALRQIMRHHGYGDDDDIEAALSLPDDELAKNLSACELHFERAEKMDGLEPDEIKAHHWIRSGLGACCNRCSYECSAEDGARAIGDECVCQDCLTIADLLQGDRWDIEQAEEELIELMMDHECAEDEVREVLSRSIDPALIPAAMWEKCLKTAITEGSDG